MGAEQFECSESGTTIQKAYAAAVERALYDHGHSGYTGTIAEKSGFVEFNVPAPIDASEFVGLVLWATYDDEKAAELTTLIGAAPAERIMAVTNDKWGPAAAVKINDDTWTFFGWASC